MITFVLGAIFEILQLTRRQVEKKSNPQRERDDGKGFVKGSSTVKDLKLWWGNLIHETLFV